MWMRKFSSIFFNSDILCYNSLYVSGCLFSINLPILLGLTHLQLFLKFKPECILSLISCHYGPATTGTLTLVGHIESWWRGGGPRCTRTDARTPPKFLTLNLQCRGPLLHSFFDEGGHKARWGQQVHYIGRVLYTPLPSSTPNSTCYELGGVGGSRCTLLAGCCPHRTPLLTRRHFPSHRPQRLPAVSKPTIRHLCSPLTRPKPRDISKLPTKIDAMSNILQCSADEILNEMRPSAHVYDKYRSIAIDIAIVIDL